MDPVKKMDCRANGELISRVPKPLQPHFCKRPSPLIQRHRDKERAYLSTHSTQDQPTEGTPRVPTTMTQERNDHAQ